MPRYILRLHNSFKNKKNINNRSPTTNDENKIANIIHKHSGLCLGARDGKIDDVVDVVLMKCDNSPSQNWYHKTINKTGGD